jgi:hypothetical protein
LPTAASPRRTSFTLLLGLGAFAESAMMITLLVAVALRIQTSCGMSFCGLPVVDIDTAEFGCLAVDGMALAGGGKTAAEQAVR